MAQLRFTAVHEDGDHLVLSSPDGAEFLLPIDERLRAAVRQRAAAADAPATPMRPRDVQAMIRAGQSVEEVTEVTGWPAERVARFEAPILAERGHISRTAQAAHVRGRAVDGVYPTLGARVEERLTARGVDTDNTNWDATRPEGGRWTVLISFVAGQRQRSASWHFDPVSRTVEALDDEARWLSEDEQALPGSATGGPLLGSAEATESVDLMTAMRERSRSRGKRRRSSTSSTDPAGLPGLADSPDQVLPLENLPYDPDTMGPPPAAHGGAGQATAPADGPHAEGTDAGGTTPEGTDTGNTTAEGTGTENTATKDTGTQDTGTKDTATDPAGTDEIDDSTSPDTAEAPGAPAAAGADHDRGGDPSAVIDSDATDAEGDEGDDDEGAGLADDENDDDADYDVDPSPQEATLADLFGTDEEYDDDLEDDLGADFEEDAAEDVVDDLGEPAEAAAAETATTESTPDEQATVDTSDLDDLDDLDGRDDANGTPPEDAAAADAADGGTADAAGGAGATDTGEAAQAADEDDSPAPEQGKSRRRKDGRPGVPSWDDIMFGAKGRR